MSTTEFALVFGLSLATMLVCRCVPIFVLKGRQLSENTQAALNLIPPAAFAALVANDLFRVDMFAGGVWPGLVPLLAALVVVLVARKTKSLIWCALVGFAMYALLSMAPLG